MARIPLIEDFSAVPAEVIEPLLKRRGGKLLKIDRLLLHSPAYADGWNGLLRPVINELDLTPRMSQLIMTAIAVLNDCEYELFAHGGSYLAAGGSQQQLDALRQGVTAAASNEALFGASERAMLALTIEMTCKVSVSDQTFEAARQAATSDRALCDVIATIATYNMVTRYVVALDLVTDQHGL